MKCSRSAAAELYDLDADPGQNNNVAAQYQDVLKKMLAYAEQAREELGDGLTNRMRHRAARAGKTSEPRLCKGCKQAGEMRTVADRD